MNVALRGVRTAFVYHARTYDLGKGVNLFWRGFIPPRVCKQVIASENSKIACEVYKCPGRRLFLASNIDRDNIRGIRPLSV